MNCKPSNMHFYAILWLCTQERKGRMKFTNWLPAKSTYLLNNSAVRASIQLVFSSGLLAKKMMGWGWSRICNSKAHLRSINETNYDMVSYVNRGNNSIQDFSLFFGILIDGLNWTNSVLKIFYHIGGWFCLWTKIFIPNNLT